MDMKNQMPNWKEMPHGTQPIASEVQAEAAAESVCSRLQSDHDSSEPVRRTYAAFIKRYAREVARLSADQFREEVEYILYAGDGAFNDDIHVLKAEVLGQIEPEVVNEVRMKAARGRRGTA
jgi:hypothetical protein